MVRTQRSGKIQSIIRASLCLAAAMFPLAQLADAGVITFDANVDLTVSTNYNAGAGPGPANTEDILFGTGYPTAAAIFQAGTGATATSFAAESINTSNANAITIGNNSSNATASNATLTLGNPTAQANAVSGAAASDLIYVGGTGNLTIQGANLRNGQATGNGTLAITLAQSGTFNVVNAGANLTVSAPISGAFAVTKTGAGALVFGGTHAFGSLTIKEGTVGVITTNALGSGTLTLGDSIGSANATIVSAKSLNNNIVVQAGTTGILTLAQNSVNANTGTVAGDSITYSGTVALNNDLTVTMLRSANRFVALSGVITGNKTITTSSNNNSSSEGVIISGANATSFTGNVLITGGYLGFNFNSLGQNSTGGTITFSDISTTTGNIPGLSWMGVNTQDLSGRFQALPTGTFVLLNPNSNNLTFASTDGLAGPTNSGYTKRASSAGTLTLAAANSLSGTYTADSTGGATILAHTNALQNATVSILTGVTTGGIVFDSSVVSNAFTLGNLTGAGNLSLQNNAGSPAAVALSVGNNNGSPAAYTGILGGSGSLTKIGSGTLTISGANNYAGSTAVSAGILKLGAAGVIPDTSSVTLSTGATFDLNAKSEAIDALIGTGGTVNTSATGNITLTVGTSGGSGTYDGVIQNTAGSLALVKLGGGTQTLTGVSTYTGGTTITGGTLRVNNASGSGTGSGSVTVQIGATLAGSGFIGGPVTSQTGSYVAPGNSPGTLTINNTYTLQTGALLEFDLDTPDVAAGTGGNDLIDVLGTTGLNGGFTFDTNLTLNVTPGGNWGDGTYHLVHYTGTLTDNSAGFSGWNVTGTGLGSHTYTFSTSNTPNYLDLVVTSAVPEPASLGLLVLGSAGLLLRRRR